MSIISNFLSILLTVLTLAILIRAIMSWIMPNDTSGFMKVLLDITEPILAPIRRILPPVGGIDFSPLLAIVLLQVVNNALVPLLNSG